MKNNLIKNNQGEIIALKLSKFKVEATYYTGYGANLRKLRGVAKKSCEVLATSKVRALEIAERVHNIKDTGGLSAGYITTAKKIKY